MCAVRCYSKHPPSKWTRAIQARVVQGAAGGIRVREPSAVILSACVWGTACLLRRPSVPALGGHAACWSPLGRGIGSCEGAGVWGAELRAQRAPESCFDVGGGLPVTRPLICIWPTQCGVSQFSRSGKQGACTVWGIRNLAPLPGCH